MLTISPWTRTMIYGGAQEHHPRYSPNAISCVKIIDDRSVASAPCFLGMPITTPRFRVTVVGGMFNVRCSNLEAHHAQL